MQPKQTAVLPFIRKQDAVYSSTPALYVSLTYRNPISQEFSEIIIISIFNHISPWWQWIHGEARVTNAALFPKPSHWPQRTSLCWVNVMRTGLYGAKCWRLSLQPNDGHSIFSIENVFKGGEYIFKKGANYFSHLLKQLTVKFFSESLWVLAICCKGFLKFF